MIPTVLHNRQYARLWGATSISSFGNQLTYLSLPTAAYVSTGSAGAFATVFMASNVGMLVTMLLGGAFADRFDRQRMMLTSDACMLVIVSGLGWAVLTEQWWLAAVFAFVQTLVASLLHAGQALQRDIVSDEDRAQANAFTQFTMNANQLAAPLAGMWIFMTWGFGPIVVIDVATTAISFLLLVGLRDPKRAERHGSDGVELRATVRRAIADIKVGGRTVWHDGWLRAQIPGNVLGSIANGMFIVAIVPWIDTSLGLAPSMFGVMIAVVGGAGVVASVLAVRIATVLSPIAMIRAGALLGVVGCAAVVTGLPLPFVWAGLVAFGVANVVMNIGVTTTRQRRFPGDLQGRLGSLQMVNHQAGNLAGMAAAGVLVSAIGAGPVMVMFGMGVALNCVGDLVATRVLVRDPIITTDATATDAELAVSG